MKYITVGLTCLLVVTARSVVDPPIIPIGNYSNSSCNTVKCSAGHVCTLMPNEDCKQNCELFARCVVDKPQNPVDPALTCANMLCSPGYICKQETIYCIKAPCPQPSPRCVPVNESCSINEQWNSCGNACEKSCANRSPVCPMICRTEGACVCESGFVRQNGICIPETNCPQVEAPACSSNETYVTCGSACEPSCSNPKPEACTEQCIAGCQCSTGFLKNLTGSCVAANDCSESTLTCANVRCMANTECKMVESLCKKKPCPQQPQCVPGTACNLFCVNGKHCELKDVECIAPPCNPVPECVDDMAVNDTSSCAVIDCAPGYTCQEDTINCLVTPCPKQGKCVPMVSATCDTIKLKCEENFACEMNGGVPACVYNGPSSCAATLCIAESLCVEEPIPCIKAPCPVRARCVANNNTANGCASMTCPSGQECIENTPPCLVAPCPKEAICIDNNSSSGITCANIRMKCMADHQCGMVNGTPTCVPVCGKNETFLECSSCEEICGQKPMMCPAVCGKSKCQCETGYSRNITGQCVLTAECSNGSSITCDKCGDGMTCEIISGVPRCIKVEIDEPHCGKNEVYDTCGGCDSTCNNIQPICNMACLANNSRCVCAPGFVRNDDGKCVTYDKCEQLNNTTSDCHPNEDYNNCLPACEKNCRGDPCPSDVITTMQCTPGCTCKPFYKRDHNGYCQHEKRCYFHTRCEKNEYWSKCRECEKTCSTSNIDSETFTKQCNEDCSPGCRCKDGFLRNNDGNCVSEQKACV